MTNWDKKFIGLVKHISEWSKDTSSKNGAVIVDSDNVVLSMGYNGLPIGCDDSKLERFERPLKYMYTEHAERNAIYLSSRHGGSVKNGTMYVTLFPCADCARAIIQSGITKLVSPTPDVNNERWGEHFKVSLVMFKEANLTLVLY
jgi:dCMP deaminase